MSPPQPSRNTSIHCTLEAVPRSESAENYTYSVPDSTPPYSSDRVDCYYGNSMPSASPQPRKGPCNPRARQPVKRWLVPLLYGLIIAVASGVIGGVIGKAIADNDSALETQGQNAEQYSCPLNGTATPTRTKSSSSPTSSTAEDTNAIFKRTIPEPKTGCESSPTNTFPHASSNTSTYLSWPYRIICDAGWNSNELFAMSAATPSDCIEACAMYNGHRNDTDRECVGGGFIPAWWNQTKAMDESGNMPYNCFLKSNSTGISKNDRSIEVVSLCLSVDGGYCVDATL